MRRDDVVEEYLRLHVSEVQPEAHMRAAAEGHPRIFVPLARDFGRKAHRVELFGLRPMPRHHMRIGGAAAARGARRNARTALSFGNAPGGERGGQEEWISVG